MLQMEENILILQNYKCKEKQILLYVVNNLKHIIITSKSA